MDGRRLREKSLDEIERWRPPSPSRPTDYDVLFLRVRATPLSALTDADLTFLIQNGQSLEWLMPMVLERLEEDPWREAELYEGDLLCVVIDLGTDYWAANWEWRSRLLDILDGLDEEPDDMDEAIRVLRALEAS